MKQHVKETDLALYASGDLRLWQRAAVHLHVRQCASCRERVEEFRADARMLREAAAKLPEGLDWARLASEMTANIHVGLAAGECVSPRGRAGRLHKSILAVWRPVALASFVAAMLVVLLAMPPKEPWRGFWLFGVLAGSLDTLGNLFYIQTTRLGRLDTAAMICSLYPAGTILLAALVLREWPTRRQFTGIALALFAVALLSV